MHKKTTANTEQAYN